MIRNVVQMAVLTGTLVLGVVPGAVARQSDQDPLSTGVVATITSVNAHHGLATLTTEGGEVFVLPKETLWKVGDKVECDRTENQGYPRLQDCKPWQ